MNFSWFQKRSNVDLNCWRIENVVNNMDENIVVIVELWINEENVQRAVICGKTEVSLDCNFPTANANKIFREDGRIEIKNYLRIIVERYGEFVFSNSTRNEGNSYIFCGPCFEEKTERVLMFLCRPHKTGKRGNLTISKTWKGKIKFGIQWLS